MLSQRDLGWIAGFLEGEGHFRFARNSKRGGGTLVVTADQVQRLPLDHLVQLVGGKVYFYQMEKRHIHVWQMRGKPAAGLMFTVYSLMSPRRREQISKSISEWKTMGTYNGNKTHCKRGHEFTPENTIKFFHRGKAARRCRECDRLVHSYSERKKRRLRVISISGEPSCWEPC